MKRKGKFISAKDTTVPLADFVARFPTERRAIAYLEGVRWPGGAVCPRCGGRVTYACNRRGSPGYRECAACRRVFTVRTGTALERSHVPLSKWLHACYRVVTARKGTSSVQLAVEVGVTQKTAWFMLQRLRHACGRTTDAAGALRGIVEADGAYFGGSERCRHRGMKLGMGRGCVGKRCVLGARERGGRVSARVVGETGREAVHGALSGMVDGGASLMTDEHASYEGVPFATHGTVRHSAAEFVSGEASTNGIESVWAVMKRGWKGVYHRMSPKHLQLYANEFCFRLNEGRCQLHLDGRIASLCRFALASPHVTYGELTSGTGDGGLWRAA